MKKILFLFLVVVQMQCGWAQRAIPDLWGHQVHDEAHVLSQATIDQLESLLKAHEDSTTNQIAVLVIPSLEGEELETYSLRVAHDTWKLGQKTNDNGVLLLVVIDDRKMRIEVGQGLEGVLTDAIAGRIIRKEMAPYFREQKYDEGINAAVDAIIKAIGQEYSAADAEEENSTLQADLSWKERLMLGAFIFGILGIFTAVALFVPGCTGWFLYLFLIPFYASFPMVILGVSGGLTALGIYAIGFPVLKLTLGKTNWGKRMAKSMGTGSTRSGAGWSSGGWSGGSSRSSSGSSFSGGGGSFGGGGSSGSW
jgi:uncharacterized protein